MVLNAFHKNRMSQILELSFLLCTRTALTVDKKASDVWKNDSICIIQSFTKMTVQACRLQRHSDVLLAHIASNRIDYVYIKFMCTGTSTSAITGHQALILNDVLIQLSGLPCFINFLPL